LNCIPSICIGPNCNDGKCIGLGCIFNGCIGLGCDGGTGHCRGLKCLSIGCWGFDCFSGGGGLKICLGPNCSVRTCIGLNCQSSNCIDPSCTHVGGMRGGGPDAVSSARLNAPKETNTHRFYSRRKKKKMNRIPAPQAACFLLAPLSTLSSHLCSQISPPKQCPPALPQPILRWRRAPELQQSSQQQAQRPLRLNNYATKQIVVVVVQAGTRER
jgi:hypothetical protein